MAELAQPITTQEDLDRIVETRLQRDREARGEELKSAKADLEAANTKLQTLESVKATAEQTDSAMKEIVGDLLAKVPEDKKGLVPEELSPAAKARFILKNQAHLYGTTAAAPPGAPSVTPPTTPPGGKPPVAINTGDIPGAKREVGADGEPIITITDAKAYQQWRREGNRP